jgi:hypothetical protein
MSQTSESSPRRGVLQSVRNLIRRIGWDTIVAVSAAYIAFSFGHAQGFKEGVHEAWRAEMTVLRELAKDDAATSNQ